MKRLFLIICGLPLLVSCSRSGAIERSIGERVNACQTPNTCIIKIKDLTDFQWDQMHVFTAGASQQMIEKTLGTTFPDYVEFKRRIIFLNNGAIVHREDEPTDLERTVDGEVSFAKSYAEPSHWSFTPDSAVFSAEKRGFDRGTYYVLKPK